MKHEKRHTSKNETSSSPGYHLHRPSSLNPPSPGDSQLCGLLMYNYCAQHFAGSGNYSFVEIKLG